MELRTYARIIWRYIWLIVLVVGVVAAYSGYQYYKLRKTAGALTDYNSNISIQIGLVDATTKGDPNPADNVTVSEALADTLASGPILSSREFCNDIYHQIGQDMSEIEQRYGSSPNLGNWQDPSAIAGALSATRSHSLVTISVNWDTVAGAWAITNAIGEISSSRIGQYLDYVIATDYTYTSKVGNYIQPEVSARVISAASTPGTVPGSSASKVTLLVLLVVIALAMAIALAFLLDYLDDRIRTKEDVADLFQLPIYGEVPHAPAPGHSLRARSESVV